MAFLTGSIRSNALMMDTQLSVLLPQDKKLFTDEKELPRLLILLHGLSDNSSSWVRNTSIERYAESYNLVIAMPEAQRSFYNNMTYGLAYESYIAEELPVLLRKLFHVSDKKDDTIIAGLSMGGFGSLWCSLRHPDTFGYCGSFSGALEPGLVEATEEQLRFTGSHMPDLKNILGDRPAEEMSINKLFDKAYKNGRIPRLFMTCGTKDFLYQQNKDFSDKLKNLKGIDFTYYEWEGDHEWSFWDKSVKMMLDHIFSHYTR